MQIKEKACAGTMQSSDLMVHVEPCDSLIVDIESTVKKQYGDLIRSKVYSIMESLCVKSGHIRVTDRGALDYSIAARVETAIRRASGE